jgi:hypothetical protein
LNLSTSRPDQLPIPTTLGASSTAGMVIRHVSMGRTGRAPKSSME